MQAQWGSKRWDVTDVGIMGHGCGQNNRSNWYCHIRIWVSAITIVNGFQFRYSLGSVLAGWKRYKVQSWRGWLTSTACSAATRVFRCLRLVFPLSLAHSLSLSHNYLTSIFTFPLSISSWFLLEGGKWRRNLDERALSSYRTTVSLMKLHTTFGDYNKNMNGDSEWKIWIFQDQKW